MKTRKARNANRGTLQAIEDGFCDLPLPAQERMLETLAGLHRQAVRMSRSAEVPATPSNAADPAKNAALLLEETEGTRQ